MRVRCNDEITRDFTVCRPLNYGTGNPVSRNDDLNGSICIKCGYDFGVHDTKILKPLWKAHICENDKIFYPIETDRIGEAFP